MQLTWIENEENIFECKTPLGTITIEVNYLCGSYDDDTLETQIIVWVEGTPLYDNPDGEFSDGEKFVKRFLQEKALELDIFYDEIQIWKED